MSRKKILVVDDDQVIVKGLAYKLKARGYEVLTASDGSSAIQIVRAENPDLLVFDINFPVEISSSWDGFQILAWLERLNEDWHKPVIIITGEEDKDYEDKARKAGAVAFFRKPVDHDQLLAVISRELGEEPSQTKPAS